MKFPSHIFLDFNKSTHTNTTQYWVISYLFSKNRSTYFLDSLNLHKQLFLNKKFNFANYITQNTHKFTISYKTNTQLNNLHFTRLTTFFLQKPQINNRLTYSKNSLVNTFYSIKNPQNTFNTNQLGLLIKNFSLNVDKNLPTTAVINLNSYFDINFLRKEKIYTKLKYSRVPQYDIVSGGVAALFAGFLGFLICEKFGFEMVDSGDFYFLFMYLVFLFFFCRLFLRIIDAENNAWSFFSFKWLFFFINTLVSLVLKKLYSFLKYFLN